MRLAVPMRILMQRLILLSWCLVVFLMGARIVSAKEWRGIVPLHSTRADVVRLFGSCSQPDGGCQFQLGNEEIHIVFSTGLMSEYHECARKLPPETVLLIEVKLTTPARLEALRITQKNFRTFDPSTPPKMGYKGFIDEKEGLVINTYRGKVLQLDFIAASKDVHLCPSYYEDPKSFIQVFIETYIPGPAVTCPSTEPVAGEKIVFSADDIDLQRVTYQWTVTAGKIVGGQGTRRIVVDTTGIGGKTITATIERHDGSNRVATTSCGVFVRQQ